MTGKRTYGDRCGVSRALDVVGERWALLVVRELLLGPKRFSDLRAGLPHLSPDVLAQRLRELEQAGVLHRRTLPPPAAARVYELTDRGQELEPVVLALGRWGSAVPFSEQGDAFGADSAMIACQTLFDPARAGDLDAEYELRLGNQAFRARVKAGRFELARGPAEAAVAIVATEPVTLAALLWHGLKLSAGVRAGEVRIEGSRPAAQRFLRLFPLPTNGIGRGGGIDNR
ncbi:MAG: winged helix-turn-helix transcriptional regulator [Actinomycetota bacterium]|nr:winged helix-turn-helix transcriptional regulator [Actinomycetota bacterium]